MRRSRTRTWTKMTSTRRAPRMGMWTWRPALRLQKRHHEAGAAAEEARAAAEEARAAAEEARAAAEEAVPQ
jgi:hypothetical protein